MPPRLPCPTVPEARVSNKAHHSTVPVNVTHALRPGPNGLMTHLMKYGAPCRFPGCAFAGPVHVVPFPEHAQYQLFPNGAHVLNPAVVYASQSGSRSVIVTFQALADNDAFTAQIVNVAVCATAIVVGVTVFTMLITGQLTYTCVVALYEIPKCCAHVYVGPVGPQYAVAAALFVIIVPSLVMPIARPAPNSITATANTVISLLRLPTAPGLRVRSIYLLKVMHQSLAPAATGMTAESPPPRLSRGGPIRPSTSKSQRMYAA